MRRYRAEIVLLVCTLALCLVAVRAFSQDAPKPPAPTLKPGDDVNPNELESARLGKWKAQIDKLDAQATVLQQQYAAIANDRRNVQAKIDEQVKEIKARIKAEHGVEVTYDPAAGENGIFHVLPVTPAPPPSAPAPPTKK